MKKITAVLMCLILVLSAAGCGKKDDTPKKDTAAAGSTQAVTETPAAATAAPAVDDSNEQVTVIMTNQLFGEFDDDSLKELVTSKGYISGVMNDDGTASVVMTKAQQKAYLEEIKKTMKENIETIYDDPDYGANIADISFNDDCTVFSVSLKDGTVGMSEFMIAIALSAYISAYTKAAGVDATQARIDYYDAATGALVSSTADEDFGDDLDLFSSFGDNSIEFSPSNMSNVMIADTDEFSFVISSIDPNGTWGYTINADVVNKGTRNLNFSFEDESINDWTIPSYFGASVAAGDSQTVEISFSKYSIAEIGIQDPTRITFTLSVVDDDDWFGDKLWNGEYTIYPLGEDNDVDYAFVPAEDDICICDDEYASIYITGADPDYMWGYQTEFVIINKSDISLLAGWRSPSVNDWYLDSGWEAEVAPGKMAAASAYFGTDVLERAGIDEILKIEFTPSITDADSWDGVNLYTGPSYIIYPNGEAAYTYKAWEKPADALASDETDKFSFVVTGLEKDDSWNTQNICFYLENKADFDAFFDIDSVIVNGQRLEYGFPRCPLPAGLRGMNHCGIDEDTLQAEGIESIDSLVLSYSIYEDTDDWDAEALYSATITVK